MIVDTRDDVLHLSGSLVRNHWLAVKAAANLLLEEYPSGIIIDCSELTTVTPEGARLFLDALNDIQTARSRIIVCNLPPEADDVLRAIPGVRSRLPIAQTLTEARESLRLGDGDALPGRHGVMIVPLLEGVKLEAAVSTACLQAAAFGLHIRFVCLLQVARDLPMGTPLPEDEARAAKVLETAGDLARQSNVEFSTEMHRVRDATEGLLQAVAAECPVLVAVNSEGADPGMPGYQDLVNALLRRASCGVIVGRG